MTRKSLSLIAAGGSLALLAGAFLFQTLGYLPCKMCLWQRWPHVVAIGMGVLMLIVPNRAWPWIGAAAAAVTSGLGLYHTGVERGWWEGPTSCTSTGTSLSDLGGSDLLSMDGPGIVLCDQVSWAFAGLSMASWNAIFSLILAIIWVRAATAKAAR
ncbi:disulfide bond formation protein B [Pseudoroseicyclus tamaricis]|uniref:Disulfide bond formation protein B n=1 Tax=Pseudoroseicyclus tamaricis TaxID=2705421 RepID=A0A6B2JTC1_9RHOB|nr:disulfide bond formation protein B [Pseudoroseicyclus tamaricis]NDV01508.1 disulfide bond formation protein B [Pseudoroseicyclus tamaricis]